MPFIQNEDRFLQAKQEAELKLKQVEDKSNDDIYKATLELKIALLLEEIESLGGGA